MARIEIGKYLASDSRVCGGRLIFKGSRIKVADALAGHHLVIQAVSIQISSIIQI